MMWELHFYSYPYNAAVAEENSEILNEQANYELTRTSIFSFIH